MHASSSTTHSATSKIYTLSLHDALPILSSINRLKFCSATRCLLSRETRYEGFGRCPARSGSTASRRFWPGTFRILRTRSEEHTSELQSLTKLVCRLLL